MSDSSNPSRPSRRRWIAVVLLLSVSGVAGWWFWPQIQPYLPFTNPDDAASAKQDPSSPKGPGRRGPGGMMAERTPVLVTPATLGTFEIIDKSLGTVSPLNTSNVRSRVAGELIEILFEEGQRVEAGDLLARIDPRPYRIALKEALGTLAQNQALLKNSRLDLQRYQQLYADDSVARQTLDTQQADVNQYTGVIASNQAAVDDAKLNLEYTEIRAPISGRLGLRQLDVGNILTANDTTALVVITQTQPISIIFTLPEKDLAPVLMRYRQGEKLQVQAWDRSDSVLLAEGYLHSVDNQIDLTTGTLQLKARFENDDELLIPNQFINVRLRVETLDKVVLIPSAAVQFGSKGSFVYVIDAENKARMRQIEVAETDGTTSVIATGVEAGERVVLEGTERLREGAEVEVVGEQQPTAASVEEIPLDPPKP